MDPATTQPAGVDGDPVLGLLELQDGVIARWQVEEVGGTAASIRRRIRRREWVRLFPGVYLHHTGTPTWKQRAWAGVLGHWPAALDADSALRAMVGPGWRRHRDDAPVRLVVDENRHVAALPGYRLRRITGFTNRVQWNATPPRIRVEDAVLDLAAAEVTDLAAVGRLADACQARLTTAPRLLEALRQRRRLRRRAWLGSVLADIAAGTCSVLEHAYLTRVERPHGLPRPRRQHPHGPPGRIQRRDVEYDGLGVVIELDGRLFHDTAAQRDIDLDRDLDDAAAGRRALRLGWGQVLDRPCRTAARVAVVLTAAGWAGTPHPCGPRCALGATSR